MPIVPPYGVARMPTRVQDIPNDNIGLEDRKASFVFECNFQAWDFNVASVIK